MESLEGRVLLSSAPVFVGPGGLNSSQQVADNYVLISGDGQSLTIPIDGYDADGNPLTITATGSAHLNVQVARSTEFAQLDFVESDGTTSIGSIIIQLFGDLSPQATQRFITLATKYISSTGIISDPAAGQPAFYSNVVVHRVIPEFVIQTGDAANGDGTGDSPLPNFNGDYPSALGFEGVGVLAFANKGADPTTGQGTNNGQFFITDGAYPSGVGGYPIFGQVISGWDIIRNVINRQQDSSGSNRPLDPPKLKSVELVSEPQDGSIFVTPAAGFTSAEVITVTLDDGAGGHTSQQYTIQPTEPTLPVISAVSPLDLATNPQGSIPFTISYSGPDGGSLGIAVFHNYHGAGTVSVNTAQSTTTAGGYTATFTPDASYDGTLFTATFLAQLLNFGNATRAVQRTTVQYGTRPTIASVEPPTVLAGQSTVVSLSISDASTSSFYVTAASDTPGVTVTVDMSTYDVTITVSTSAAATTANITVTAIEASYQNKNFTPTSLTFAVNISQFVFNALPAITGVLPGETRQVPLDVQVPVDASVSRTLNWTVDTSSYTGPGTISAQVSGDAASGYTLTLTLPATYDESNFTLTISATMAEFPSLPAQTQSATVQSSIRPIISNIGPLFMAPGSSQDVLFNVVDTVSATTAVNVRADVFDDQGQPLNGATATVSPVAGQSTQYRLSITAPVGYYGVFNIKLSAIESDVAINFPNLAPSTETVSVITMGFVPQPGQVDVNPNGTGVSLGLQGYTSDGSALTYTASTGSSDLDVYVAPPTNSFAQLNFVDAQGNSIGSVVVELFNDRSPAGVQRFENLATLAVANNTLVTPGGAHPYPYYHNVPVTALSRGLFLQTGRAAGASGSGLSPITNDPALAAGQSGQLSFDGPGMLAFTASSSGMSDDQFLITDGSQSQRDGSNLLVFGQIVSGWDVLRQVEMTPTASGSTAVTAPQPALSSVRVVTQPQAGSITIVSKNPGLTGDIPVTLTATDGSGHSYSQQVTAHMTADLTTPRAAVTSPLTSVIATGRDTIVPFQITQTATGTFAFKIYTTYAGPGAVALMYAKSGLTSFSQNGSTVTGSTPYVLHVVVPPEYDGSAFRALLVPVDVGLANGMLTSQLVTISFGTRPLVGISNVTFDPTTGPSTLVPGTITSDAAAFTFSTPTADNGATATIVQGSDPKAFNVQVSMPSSTFSGIIHVSFTVLESQYAEFVNVRPATVSFLVYTFGASIPGSTFEVPTNGRGVSIGIDGLDPANTGLTYNATTTDPGLHLSWDLGSDTGREFAKLTFVNTVPVDTNGDGIPDSYQDAGTVGVITVMLYNDVAPQAVQRFIDLAENYRGIVSTDSTGKQVTTYTMDSSKTGYATANPYYSDVNIYSLLTGGLFYTGDPIHNDGTGKTGLPAMNTSFMDTWAYKELSFAGPGVLAFNDTGGNPATSDGTFFITQRPFPNGDGRYPVFGQIVSGWDVYNDLIFRSNNQLFQSTQDPTKNFAPLVPPRLQSVQILGGAADTRDAVLNIRADQNFAGPAQVQVTVRDSQGDSNIQTLTIEPDSAIAPMAQVQGITDSTTQQLTSDSIGDRSLPPSTRIVDMRFQQTHPAGVTIEPKMGNSYRGPGQVSITAASAGNTTNSDGTVTDTFSLHIVLPDAYDGTPVVIWLWVVPQGDGNAQSTIDPFYISTLGDAPVIGDAVTLTDASGSALPGSPVAATSNQAHFKLDITASDVVHTTIETRVDGQSGSVVQPTLANDGGIFTVTVPEGFYGLVTFNITAVQDKDTTTQVFTPVSRQFSLAFSPVRDAPNQVAPVLWRIQNDAYSVLQTSDFIFVGTVDQGLWVYDAADPTKVLGSYTWPISISASGSSSSQPVIYDMKMMTYGSGPSARQILFVAASSQGLVSFSLDKSNSTNVLQLLDTFPNIDASQVVVENRTVSVGGNLVTQLAYVGAIEGGLYILDASNPGLLGRDPADPTNAAARRPLAVVTALYPTLAQQIQYQYAYQSHGQYTVNPYLMPLPLRWPTSLFVNNGIVTLTDVLSGYIAVINATQPDRVVKLKAVKLGSPIWGSAVEGNTLYVLAQNGLHVYDASTPWALKSISFWPHQYIGTNVLPSLAVYGDTAVIGYADGFDFLNVRDPYHITYWGTSSPTASSTSSTGQGIFASAWSNTSTTTSTTGASTTTTTRDYAYAGRVPSFYVSGDNVTWLLPNGYGGLTAIDGSQLSHLAQINSRSTLIDANGTPVTYTIAGGGFIQLTLDSTQTHVDRLDVVNPTAATRVTISTPGGTTTDIGEIDVHGSLNALVAPTVVMDGNVTLDGTVRTLMLGKMGTATGGAEKTLAIGAPPAGTVRAGATLNLGSVYDLSISSSTPISSLTAVSWLDDESASAKDTIVAPSLGRLMITGRPGQRGDFQADVTVNGGGQAIPAIQLVNIAGDVSQSNWNVGAISTAIIGGDLAGQWQATSLRSLIVRGNMDGWTGLLTQRAVANSHALTLGSLNVMGSITASNVIVAGDIGAVTAAAMNNSEIYAGYLAVAPASVALPTAQQMIPTVFDTLGSIASLTIRGQQNAGSFINSFVNSDIAAYHLGIMNLAYAQVNNGGTPFGLAAHSLSRLLYHDATTHYTWPNGVDTSSPAPMTDLITRLV